jgi:hypothetical protein
MSQSLGEVEKRLQRMIAQCARGRIADCRVIEMLSDETHAHGRRVRVC